MVLCDQGVVDTAVKAKADIHLTHHYLLLQLELLGVGGVGLRGHLHLEIDRPHSGPSAQVMVVHVHLTLL